jgi:hypothetical protein
MWIELATSATPPIHPIHHIPPTLAILATLATHPTLTITAYKHLSRSKDLWLTSYLLFYEESSWRNAYCSCMLHFWKYEIWDMTYWNIEILNMIGWIFHTSNPDNHTLQTFITLKKSLARFIYLLFYETSSWRNAYCSCMLHFLKIWNMDMKHET